eukprot:327347-Chlamydomonas_euryale.AAC.3
MGEGLLSCCRKSVALPARRGNVATLRAHLPAAAAAARPACVPAFSVDEILSHPLRCPAPGRAR